MKALRGTKRVCHACAIRFYDLSRESIVCPACGAPYVPDALPRAPEVGARAARFTDKTGWRSRSAKHPDPAPPDPDPPDLDPEVAPEAPSTEDANEEALSPAANEDAILEEEPDEADISGLLGQHESEPKER